MGYAMSTSLKIIINPSELGAGTRGSSLGPLAVQAAARARGNPLFSEIPWEVLPDWNQLLDQPATTLFAKRIHGMREVYRAVSDSVSACLLKNTFPLLISGDHASAGGTFWAIKNAFPNKRIGVVWIDAHADLHSPYTTPSGNLHGMPLATALDGDNLGCQRNEVDIITAAAWKELKSHSLKSSDLIYVGVRSTEPEEDHIISSENITKISVTKLRKLGVEYVLSTILSQLKKCDVMYVSFDVDSMDPRETSFGTGTPEPGGFTQEEARQLLIGLCNSPKIAVLEFAEINPLLDDKNNAMAEVTLDLITHCKNTLLNRWNQG